MNNLIHTRQWITRPMMSKLSAGADKVQWNINPLLETIYITNSYIICYFNNIHHSSWLNKTFMFKVRLWSMQTNNFVNVSSVTGCQELVVYAHAQKCVNARQWVELQWNTTSMPVKELIWISTHQWKICKNEKSMQHGLLACQDQSLKANYPKCI